MVTRLYDRVMPDRQEHLACGALRPAIFAAQTLHMASVLAAAVLAASVLEAAAVAAVTPAAAVSAAAVLAAAVRLVAPRSMLLDFCRRPLSSGFPDRNLHILGHRLAHIFFLVRSL